MAYKYNEQLGYEVDKEGYPNLADPRYLHSIKQQERSGIVGRMQSSGSTTPQRWDEIDRNARVEIQAEAVRRERIQ